MAVGEWDRRELCSDGSCTGLIGPEGTCKVCGRAAPNWGEERKRGTQDIDDDEEDEDADDDDVAPDPIKPATKVAIGGGEWSARALCPDGGCVGLIGEDGTCKVCGKTGVPPPRTAAAAEADDDAEYDDDEADDDSEGEDYADEDDDDEDDELAAAADELAGVASHAEVASTSAAITRGPDGEEYRKLCPDGACIGVIGLDGKCKICKTEAA